MLLVAEKRHAFQDTVVVVQVAYLRLYPNLYFVVRRNEEYNVYHTMYNAIRH